MCDFSLNIYRFFCDAVYKENFVKLVYLFKIDNFFQANYPPKVILPSDQRITVHELVEWNKINKKYLILDVRPNVEFEMCHLPNSINITLKELCSKANRDKCFKDLEDRFKEEINTVSSRYF